jgi:putative alpha-1,2-mannosidase
MMSHDPEKKPVYFKPRLGKTSQISLGRNLPRRSRVLSVALLVAFALWLFPATRLRISGIFPDFLPRPDAGSPGRWPGFPKDDVLRYVDPLIGTANGGHVFPGASLPYGMAKAVADTNSPAENAAGYVSDNYSIVGFSHMHDSGTGGSPSMGQFPIFVHPGCLDDDYHECNFGHNERKLQRVQESVVALPGYFSVQLENQVVAEMTVTEHTALYRFGFPGEAMVDTPDGQVPYSPLLLMDLSDLGLTRSTGAVAIDDLTGRIIGEGEYRPSFGMGEYKAYFCADFRGADIRETGTFMGNKASAADKQLSGKGSSFRMPGGAAGAWLHFTPPEDDQIFARVGLSFLSSQRACRNAEREIPDFGFASVMKSAADAWRQKLSVIEVDERGVSEDFLKMFWSGLYRTMLSPQNYTGENQLWNSTEPYYDS